MLTRRYLLQVNKELRHQNDQEIKISLWNKGTKMKLEKINLNILLKAIKEQTNRVRNKLSKTGLEMTHTLSANQECDTIKRKKKVV